MFASQTRYNFIAIYLFHKCDMQGSALRYGNISTTRALLAYRTSEASISHLKSISQILIRIYIADLYRSSFKSPSFIQPFFLINSLIKKFNTAGRTNINRIIPIYPHAPEVYANKSNTPTSPLVPIPPPDAPHLSWKRQVESGPQIPLEIIIGNMVIGFFMIFGICSMLVPIPCAIKPPTLFSR